MSFKISLAGDLGSGKSTVSGLLLDKIGAEYYGTGIIAREIAESLGLDIAGLNIYMETHPELDREFDNRLVTLSDDPRNLIIDSRMAWHFTRGTFRVYLSIDDMTAAYRVMLAGRAAEKFATVEEAAERIKARRESEKKRYFELYGVDCKDLSNYDLVIDTTYATPEEVAAVLEAGLAAWQKDPAWRGRYICQKRLFYPDDAPDTALVERYARALEAGEEIPPVSVVCREDRFYVTGGAESALAYALAEKTFVPCELVTGDPDPAAYVRMEDNL